MVKVLTGVQPGQVSQAEQEVIAGSPVADLKERVPQSEGLDSLLQPAPEPQIQAPSLEADVAAGLEAGLADQEAQRVPTITERSKGEVPSVRWSPEAGLKTVAQSDGGVGSRAVALSDKYATSSKAGGGLGFLPSATTDSAGLTGAFAKTGAILEQRKETNEDGSSGFVTQIDPAFLQIGSAVTENIITRLAAGQAATDSIVDNVINEATGEVETRSPTGQVSKSQANAEIGREINREYQRIKNKQRGLPTDAYTDLSNEDAATIGDSFKEMYAAANPNFLKRVRPEGGGQVYYQLTPEGDANLNSDAAAYKRAQMFPGINVRPLKAPTKSGQIPGETGRVATRKATGNIKGTPAGRDLIEESTRNLNKVANVVDKQRMKILFTTILPSLMHSQDANPVWAEINNIGESAAKKFAAAEAAAQRDLIPYDAAEEMAKLEHGIAQNVRAIAMERKGANYLTYYIQNFNGRTAPQQSFFDPTTSKAVRFVTRNAVPAKAEKGNRQFHNLQQMYSMMLVKGADAVLPYERVQMLERDTPKLHAWGKMLQEALDNAMTDAQAEQVAAAIEAGQPLGQIPFNQLEVTDPDLLAAIKSKGEDGPHFIDGLIDFAKFKDAMDAGRPYHSYFNAYTDGKTNGIASNGIQMGSRDVAMKTGVMRTGKSSLLDEGDVRDFLMSELTDQLESSGLQSREPELYTVAHELYNYRQLAKDTTMTFGYGKELASFKNDVSSTLDFLIQDKPEVALAMESLINKGYQREKIVEDLHKEYVNHLGGALSAEAMESRPLMRGAALYFALIDKPFNLTTATGFELNLGGEVTTGEHGEGYTEQEYTIWEDGKKRTVTSQIYGTKSTALAPKGDQGIGSRAWGGSLPGPVQSLDAATVAMSTTGDSWKKLVNASDGNPYIHHVYDAIKTDANGFDVMLEEVNKNWLNASLEWSYLQSTLDSLQQNMKDFQKEISHYPDDMPILTGATDQFGMFGDLIHEYESMSGSLAPWNLVKKLSAVREQPAGLDDEQWFFQNLKMARAMVADLRQSGMDPANPKMKDFKYFMKQLNGAVDLQNRLRKMITKTDNNKKNLRQDIERLAPKSPTKALEPMYKALRYGGQYYAH